MIKQNDVNKMIKQNNLSCEDLINLEKLIPEDPLVTYMKERGFDPARGAYLIVPISYRDRFSWGRLGSPDYVRFSNLVSEPTMVRYMTVEEDGR